MLTLSLSTDVGGLTQIKKESSTLHWNVLNNARYGIATTLHWPCSDLAHQNLFPKPFFDAAHEVVKARPSYPQTSMTNLLALELPLAAHVPLDERKLIIDDLVSRARNESGTDAATFLLQLLEVWEEQGRQSQIEDIVLDRVHKAQYDDAARISAASARMYQWALEHHTSQIAQNVQSLRVPENTNLSAQSYHADDDDMSNDQSHDTTRHALLILRQSLTCLSLLYGAYPPPQSVQWPSALIPQILLILQSEHQDMNDPAKGALLAYTNLYKPSMKVEEVTSVPGYEEYDGLIWPFCNQMLRTAIKPLSRTIALQVWLRWLIFLPDRANVKNMISSSIYWWHIRHALAHGDVEQGKLCLQIMRISLPLAVKYNSMAGVRNVLELAITCSDHRRSLLSVYSRSLYLLTHASLDTVKTALLLIPNTYFL